MRVLEMLEIVANCVPVEFEDKFVDPETGEMFTGEELRKIEGDIEKAIDEMGMAVIEYKARAEMKKEIANKYREQAKHDENRAERLQYFLGFITDGKKRKCDHVTIYFSGKQERLAFRCKESEISDKYKKDYTRRVVDNDLIRKELEKEKSPVLSFAYIDKRKKASVK